MQLAPTGWQDCGHGPEEIDVSSHNISYLILEVDRHTRGHLPGPSMTAESHRVKDLRGSSAALTATAILF